MKEKPPALELSLELYGGFVGVGIFNLEYLTSFGGLLRIQCLALVQCISLTITSDNRGTDNGSQFASNLEKKTHTHTHRNEVNHNSNEVRLFN